MRQFEYTIQMEAVLHARPVAAMVQRLKPLQEQVTLTCGARSADAKKIFAVMAMGLQRDETVNVVVDGPDEEKVANDLLAFFQANF